MEKLILLQQIWICVDCENKIFIVNLDEKNISNDAWQTMMSLV
jgi:hypothetical protein